MKKEYFMSQTLKIFTGIPVWASSEEEAIEKSDHIVENILKDITEKDERLGYCSIILTDNEIWSIDGRVVYNRDEEDNEETEEI